MHWGNSRRIVIVDREPISVAALASVLEEAGHQVVRTSTAAGLAAALEQETAAVLLEGRLPDIEKARLRRELRDQHFAGPVLFVSGRPDTRANLRAVGQRPDNCLLEP